MIFLNQRGQGAIEAIMTAMIVFMTSIIGIALMINGLCTIILTKWASKTSHCVAQSRPADECRTQTIQGLTNRFAFHDVIVRITPFRGIIRSEVTGHVFGPITLGSYSYNPLLKGSYALEPSEYKRVK